MPQTPHQDPPRDLLQELFQPFYSLPPDQQAVFWCRVLRLIPFDDPRVLSALHRHLTPRLLLAFLELCQVTEYAGPLTPAGEEAGLRPPDETQLQERLKLALAHKAAALEVVAAERGLKERYASELRRRTPRKRNQDRDAYIVHLRDVEKKTFGQIPRLLLLKNSRWGRRDGEPLARDAVEQAYNRFKV